MDAVITQLANGLVLGVIYVLVAIGLSMIFGQLGLINFAHGAFLTLTAYMALTLYPALGWLGVALAPVLIAGVGMIVERLLLYRAYGLEPRFGLVLTFALSLFIEALIRSVWGSENRPFPTPDIFRGVVEYGPILLTKYRLFVVVMTIAILAALWAFMKYTAYGKILRAAARDPEMMGLLGINSKKVFTCVFGLGTLLAGLAGILASPLYSVSPNMSETLLMPAFVTITIGGLGSYLGATIAGLLVGVVTGLTIQLWPEASTAAMYVLMIAVLLIRPRGLLGERWERFE